MPQSQTSGAEWREKQLRNWNLIAEAFGRPKARVITPARQRQLKARFVEVPNFWRELERAFCNLGPFALENGWLTFDWILLPANLTKLLEGNYAKAGGPKLADALAKEEAASTGSWEKQMQDWVDKTWAQA